MSYRIYPAIEDISIIDDSGREPGTLQVMACPGNTRPVAATVLSRLSFALTVEQSAELRSQLLRAEVEALEAETADPPEVAETMEVDRG